MRAPRSRWRSGVRWGAALAATVALLGTGTVASAAWYADGPGSGDSAAVVLPPGSAPSGAARGTTVIITWPAVDVVAGVPVSGYIVSRVNAFTGGPGVVGAGCSGVVTTTGCSEVNVPPGSWAYSVAPAEGNWTGQSSPPGPVITVIG